MSKRDRDRRCSMFDPEIEPRRRPTMAEEGAP
jgi:hypothetical protein